MSDSKPIRPRGGKIRIEPAHEVLPNDQGQGTPPLDSDATIVPGTTAIDRQRLRDAVPKGPGSMLAALHTLRKMPIEDAQQIAALTQPIYSALVAAADTAPDEATRLEARNAIQLLASQPNGRYLSVAYLTGRKPGKLKDDEVALFTKATAQPARVLEQLLHFARRSELNYGLLGVPQPANGLIRDAILGTSDSARAQLAIEYLKKAQVLGEASLISALLIAAGPDADPLAVLAERMSAFVQAPSSSEAVFDNPALAMRWLERLGSDPEPHLRSNSLLSRRGAIGELLRLAQHEEAGASVVRGVQLMRAPPGLRECTTQKAALAWASANGVSGSDIHGYATAEGQRFALLVGEIDFAIFQGGVLSRIENIKSGTGWAREARQQNLDALDALFEPDLLFLCPTGQGEYIDRWGTFELSSTLDTRTVGPLGATSYDESLLLTAGDIRRIAELLG